MNPKILILEDDTTLCKLYKIMLAKLGYDADAVASGEDALAHYVAARQAAAPYQAVILDLTVQEGMGGLETLRELKALDPRVYTIVASGTSRETICSEYEQQGFSDALPKPFRIGNIEECINRMKGRLAQAGS